MRNENTMGRNLLRWSLCACMMTVVLPKEQAAHAQADAGPTQGFSSGSNGTDGALDLSGAAPNSTVIFDPVAMNIDQNHDNIFHFTTITIPPTVTLRLTAKYVNGPVYWLASGAVDIKGIVNLSGDNGYTRTNLPQNRIPSIPGPGGFPGGIGGNSGANSSGRAQGGAGPAGGAPSFTNNFGATYGKGGGYTANKFLIPLLGGSGGGGGDTPESGMWGAGGGAGGGAILIASSVSISVTGQILAKGGLGGYSAVSCCNQYTGGGGAGGSIRLVAPILSGNGTLAIGGGLSQYTCGCADGISYGADGRVRLEAFQHNWGYSISGGSYTSSPPTINLVPVAPPPAVLVTSIGGVSLPPVPNGSFELPDGTINTGQAVTVNILTHGIPLKTAVEGGTVDTTVKLYLFSIDGTDQTLVSTALKEIENSPGDATATVTVTFPPGFTRGYARAKW